MVVLYVYYINMNWGGRLLTEVAEVEKNAEDEIWTDADFQAYLAESAKGDCTEALNRIQSVLERFLDHEIAHFANANALAELDRLDEAITAYQEAIRVRPDYAEAWNNLGVVCGKRGRSAEEFNAYRQAIRIKLDYSKAWHNIAHAYTQAKQYDSARDAILHLEKIDPNRATKLAEALKILSR